MTSGQASNVAKSRFEQNVQLPFELEVEYDNGPLLTPPDDAIWARVKIVDGDGEQLSLGSSKHFRTMGLMIVQLFGPLGTGDADLREIADQIATGVDGNGINLFRSVKADGLTWRTPSVTNVGRSENWWQINVTCPFYYEDFAQE